MTRNVGQRFGSSGFPGTAEAPNEALQPAAPEGAAAELMVYARHGRELVG